MRISDWSSDVCSSDLSRRTSTIWTRSEAEAAAMAARPGGSKLWSQHERQGRRHARRGGAVRAGRVRRPGGARADGGPSALRSTAKNYSQGFLDRKSVV